MARKKKEEKALPKGITKRANGTYQIRVMVDGETATASAKTRKEAESKLCVLRADLERGSYLKPDKTTVSEWFDTYMTEYKDPKLKESTAYGYRSTFKTHALPAIGDKRIQAVKPSHLQRILNGMAASGYSTGSIQYTHQALHQTFKQAVKEGLISKNPCESVNVPKGEPTKPHIALTVDEQAVFTARLQDETQLLNPFVKMMLYTGMRCGEVCALQWRDIDLKKNVIHVRHTLQWTKKSGLKLTPPKTKCSIRDIPIQPQALRILKELRRVLLSDSINAFNSETFVFHDEKMEPIRYHRVNGYVVQVSKQIQEEDPTFPVITTHVMRHTFATRAIENGMPPQVLKSILGHSSLAMTMDLYSHVLPDQKAEYMQKIAKAF